MKTYKKYYKLGASTADIYNAMTNPVMLEIWTGEPAVFITEPNTEFSLWDGSIEGKNIRFEKDKLIEQVWFFDDVESKVTIKLHATGDDTTSVELKHENIPEEAYENIAAGWDEDYFDSLAELFND